MRTLGMRMDRVSSSSRARRSISTSSRTPALADLAAEEEVADDVDVVAQREVLVDGRDAQVLGVVRPVDLDGLALPLDDALIDGVHAGDRLDQRGLSGAVVADQGDHFTGVDLQLDVGERLDGTEPLGDPAQRQHGRSGHVNHLLRRLTGGDAAPGTARRLSRANVWRTFLSGAPPVAGAGRGGAPDRLHGRRPRPATALGGPTSGRAASQAALYFAVQISATV